MNDRLKYKVFDKRDNKLKEIKGYTFSLMELEDLVAIQWANGLYEGAIPLKDLTFCQCTGLKDKNGKLIYEGDIVKDLVIPQYPYVVEYFKGGFKLKSTVSNSFLRFNTTQQEVIGNIYENKDLLEDK